MFFHTFDPTQQSQPEEPPEGMIPIKIVPNADRSAALLDAHIPLAKLKLVPAKQVIIDTESREIENDKSLPIAELRVGVMPGIILSAPVPAEEAPNGSE